jgi:hypothetical protein
MSPANRLVPITSGAWIADHSPVWCSSASAMPLASRSSATLPLTDCDRIFSRRRSPRHRRRRRARRPAPALRPARSCSRRSWCGGRRNLPSWPWLRRDALGFGLGALAMIASASRSAWRCLRWYSASSLAASSLRRRASSSSALMRSLRWSSAVSTLRGRRHRSAHADQDDEGDGDPEFRLRRTSPSYRFSDASTAASTALAVGQHAGEPLHDRGGRIAAMPRTLLIGGLGRGDGLLGLGELDATAGLPAPCASASASALSLSRVSAPIACARERASASASHRPSARVGLVLQLLRLGQIALDRVLTRVDDAADARQRNARDRSDRARRTRSRATPAAKRTCPSGTAETRALWPPSASVWAGVP